jgi:hypothetical protein
MKGRAPSVPGFIPEAEQADRCGVDTNTLRRWKARGYGPKPVKIGRFVMYAENANEQFLVRQAAKIDAERQPRGRGRPRRSGTAPEPRSPLAAKPDGGDDDR